MHPEPIAEPSPSDPALLERQRVVGITQACAVLKVEPSIGQRLISAGIGLDAARAALLTAAHEREQANEIVGGPARISGGSDSADPASIAQRAVSALLHRCNPGAYPLPPEAVEFRGQSLAGLRQVLLEAQGVRCRGWSPDQVLAYRSSNGEWLTRGAPTAFHTTSDLPGILAAVSSKLIDDAYVAVASPIKSHSRERTANDFKTIYSVRAGNVSTLTLVPEHAEIKRGTVAEQGESFRVSTYATIWAFSRQLLINDDLGPK
jgi:hypothetical protein